MNRNISSGIVRTVQTAIANGYSGYGTIAKHTGFSMSSIRRAVAVIRAAPEGGYAPREQGGVLQRTREGYVPRGHVPIHVPQEHMVPRNTPSGPREQGSRVDELFPSSLPSKGRKVEKTRARATTCSPDWQPDGKSRQYAIDQGVDPDAAAMAFLRYWSEGEGSGKTKINWQATFRNNVDWCRENKRYPYQPKSQPVPQETEEERQVRFRRQFEAYNADHPLPPIDPDWLLPGEGGL